MGSHIYTYTLHRAFLTIWWNVNLYPCQYISEKDIKLLELSKNTQGTVDKRKKLHSFFSLESSCVVFGLAVRLSHAFQQRLHINGLSRPLCLAPLLLGQVALVVLLPAPTIT